MLARPGSRGYNRRSALERINVRIDRGFGFELHFLRGQAKMQARVCLALAVMMVLTLGSVLEGRRVSSERLGLRRPVRSANS